jgi:hypothetical protein
VVKTTRTKIIITIDFETVYRMTDNEARGRAIRYLTGELNKDNMLGLYGVVNVVDETNISRSEGIER